MKSLSLRSVLVASTVLPVCALALLSDTILINFDISDIKGKPGHVRMGSGTKTAKRKRTRYGTRVAKERKEADAQHSRSGDIVKKTPSADTRLPSGPRTKGKPPTKVTVIKRPLQNLTLSVADERGAWVTGARVLVAVEGKDGKTTNHTLESGRNGQIQIKKIGPLPASVTLALAESTEAQYRIANPEKTSFVVMRASGSVVASRDVIGGALASRGGQAGKTTYRTVVYSDRVGAPVVLKRTVADLTVQVPPESRLLIAGRGEEVVAGMDGKARITMTEAEYDGGEGVLPIRIQGNLPAGPAECVLDDYRVDPYRPTEVKAPPMRLVALTEIQPAKELDVLENVDGMTKRLGDVRREKNAKRGKVTKNPDGSESWDYVPLGLTVGVRKSPFKDGRRDVSIVEAYRWTTPEAGAVGGLRVGDSMEEAWKRLGDAHGDDPRKAWEPGPGSISTWLDGGLRVCHFANRIKWIEFARSKDLLMEGTTAYVPRNAARLYLAECTPGDGPVLGSRAEIARTLAASNAVRLVDTQEDADLVLNLRVSPFREKKEKVIDAIPLSYECTVELEYDLYDTEKGTYLVRGKSSSSTSKANYEREAGLGFLGLVATLTNKNDVVKLIGGALGVAGVAELQKTMSRARERCPQYAARGAFAPVMAEIAKGADFAVRVTDIDHVKNIVTINAGTRQGIRIHSEAEPSEFEVSVGGQPLPSKVGGLTAEYSVLRVVAVHDDTAECELVKVRRSVDRVSDKVKVTPDTDSLRTLPRASTAIVSAIAMVRFARD